MDQTTTPQNHQPVQHLLYSRFGSLMGDQVIDFIEARFVIYPKSHFSKVIFRGANCSSMDIRGKSLHNLSTKSDKSGLKNMVKSEEQTRCDSSALGDDSEFALRCSTYISRHFSVFNDKDS